MSLVFDPEPPVTLATTDGRRFPVGRLLCLGRNYAEHVAEMGNTLITEDLPFFTKWPEAAAASGMEIPYPPETSDWHFEVELVAAIDKPGFRIPEDRALDHVWGYGVGVDMTRRDLQSRSKAKAHPWDWAKNGPDTAPMGMLAPVSEVGHPSEGPIRLYVDDELRQDGDLNQMIWSTAKTIAYLSRFFALKPGDLIFTGTPSGVGPVERGQTMRGEIEGLPRVEVRVSTE